MQLPGGGSLAAGPCEVGRVRSFCQRMRVCQAQGGGTGVEMQQKPLVSNKCSFGCASSGAELSCDPRAEAELESPELQDLGLGGMNWQSPP